MMHDISKRREHSAILAGLRLLQERIIRDDVPDDIAEIATNGNADPMLTAAEIETLCQTINTGS